MAIPRFVSELNPRELVDDPAPFILTNLARREHLFSSKLGQDKQCDEPSPSEQLKRKIVPQGDECENKQCGEYYICAPPQWYVDVPVHGRCHKLSTLEAMKVQT